MVRHGGEAGMNACPYWVVTRADHPA